MLAVRTDVVVRVLVDGRASAASSTEQVDRETAAIVGRIVECAEPAPEDCIAGELLWFFEGDAGGLERVALSLRG